MKLKSFIIATGTSLMLMSTACKDAKTQRAEQFADHFAQLVSENKLDSVCAVYPAAEMADEIALTYCHDSIAVLPDAEEGVYDIYLGSGVRIKAAVADDGTVSVKESKGLFKYPESKLEFARKTGAPIADVTDEQLATTMITVDNMATEIFNEYVAARKNAIKNLGITVTKDFEYMMDEGHGYYTLKNTTDQPIGGDEYEITWVYSYIGFGIEENTKKIKPGVDIPANESVRIPISFTGHDGQEISAITMHTPSQESFYKNYKPRGDEYSDYVKRYGATPEKKAKLSYGPYLIAGKLGGKYAIHINLEKGMKHGTYYYDKNGPKNTLDLAVKAFNDRTGELTLEETNDKGQVTGSFVGTLTPTSYTGTMTSFAGKSYDFDLTVINE